MQIKYHRTQKRTRLLLDILAEARIRGDCSIKIARREEKERPFELALQEG